jgi:hypothetical protein
MLQIRKLAIVVGVLLTASVAHAQKVPRVDLAQLIAIYDLDRDGVLSPRELALLNRDIQITRERAVRKGGKPPVSGPVPSGPDAKARDNDFQGVLLLRDQYSVAPFISAADRLSENGATVSWTNDRLTNQTTIQGSGALFYAFHGEMGLNTPGTVDSRAPRLTHLALIPGVEWDLTSRNGKHEGIVSARAGAEFEISGGLFSTQYVRGTAIYTTDIATSNAEIFGTEWSFVPIAPRARIGARTQLSEELGLWLGLFPTLNVEYSHVSRNGVFGDLIPNHDYLWVGPKLNAELLTLAGPLAGFSVFAKYFYLYDVLGNSASSVNYLEAGARYSLARWEPGIDPASRADLSAVFKYMVGTTPRTLTRKDEFFAGLEVKLGDLAK